MRAMLLLIGSLALFLGACTTRKGESHAPPPLDQSQLTGKWKYDSETSFLAGYDFAADGTMKMKIRGMKDPVPGKYAWTGERTVDVEYSQEADVKKAYEAAAKAFRDDVEQRVKNKELDGRAGSGMLVVVKDKLPDKESFRVAVSGGNFLILTRKDGSEMKFDRVD